jgi:hypothetical protein
MSYNLSIASGHLLSADEEQKLPQTYTSFAQAITIIDDAARLASSCQSELNKRFVEFPKLGNVLPIPVNRIEQRRTWKFNVRLHPGYVVEIFTTQTVDVDDPAMRPRQERWGVQLYHEEWDVLFHQNQGLEIGQQTRWEPTEKNFFPFDGYNWAEDREGLTCEPGQGIQTLMGVMDDLMKVIVGETEHKKAMSASKKVYVALPKNQAHLSSTTNAHISSITNSLAVSNSRESFSAEGKQHLAISESKEPGPSPACNIPHESNGRHLQMHLRPIRQSLVLSQSVEPDPDANLVCIHFFPPEGQSSTSTAGSVSLPSIPITNNSQMEEDLSLTDNDPFGDPIPRFSSYPPLTPYRPSEA